MKPPTVYEIEVNRRERQVNWLADRCLEMRAEILLSEWIEGENSTTLVMIGLSFFVAGFLAAMIAVWLMI